MVKLSYIREFLVLADTLNFTTAAEKCYIAQSALSRHIAELEEDMGGKLIERTTRSVRLTPAGEAVKKSFSEMERTYNAAKEQTAVLSAGQAGMLKISSPYYWTEDFTEPIEEEFIKDFPSCVVQIVSCQPPEGLQDVMEGKTDILLCSLTEAIDNTLRRVQIGRDKDCVVCLKDHPLAEYDELELAQAEGFPLIFVAEAKDNAIYKSANASLLNLLGKRGIYPKELHYTQQIDTLGTTIKALNGISIMPYGMRHMDRSYLKFIPLKDSDCEIIMCLYYRVDNGNPFIPKFVQEAKKIATQDRA